MRSFWLIFACCIGCSFDPESGPNAADPPDATADIATSDGGVDLSEPAPDAGTDAFSETDVLAADLGVADASDVGGRSDAGMAGGTSVVGGRLVLFTDDPADVNDCSAPMDCADADLDGLVDAWEQTILEAFRPFIVLDEEESFFDDPNAVALHVGRVAPLRRGPVSVEVYLTILYDRDYGSCGSSSSHNGDSERVALQLNVSPGVVAVEAAYTAAHEGTLTDQSSMYRGAELADLEYDRSTPGEARWIVYPSKDKHGTYPTKDVCESTSPLPCFSEECGPVFADDRSTTRLLEVFNAGEPDAPLLEDLGPLGFPDEDAWADQSFCGGHNRNFLCPGSVAGKLTESPF